MDIQPESVSSLPPPPPPASRSHTGLWIGLAAGLLALCLCGLLAAAGIWMNRQSLAGLFASPTPPGVAYTNPSLGISLYYPTGWLLEEQAGDSVIFGTSQALLDSPTTPAGGAAMAFIVSTFDDLDLPSGVNAASPESILAGFIETRLSNGSGTPPVLEAVRPFKFDSHPAASAVVRVVADTSIPAALYLTIIVRNNDILLAVGFSAEQQLARYRPVFDRILSTTTLGY